MKRNYVWAAALLMLAACSNEDVLTTTDNPDRGNEGQRVTVTATLPGNDSRLVLQEATENGQNIIKVAWNESGETFTVMTTQPHEVNSVADDVKYLFTQTEGDQFDGTLPEKVENEPYYAIYPAVSLGDFNEETGLFEHSWYNQETEDPDDYYTSLSATKVLGISLYAGTLEDISMPLMYATSTDGQQFDFHHLTAIVKFTLTGLPQEWGEDERPFDISWKGGCGTDGALDLTQPTVAQMYPATGDDDENMVYATAIPQDGTCTFYACLPPVAQGKTLTIEYKDYNEEDDLVGYTAKVELNEKGIEAGKYYRAERAMTRIGTNMTAGTVQELQTWLEAFQKYGGGINLTLTDDITLTDADDLDGDPDNQSNWPAGVDLYGETIDGGGHTLTGLKMAVTGEGEAASMFHRIYENSVVKNLHLRDVQLSSSGYCAAGVVADNEGTVSGCSVSGTITTAEGYPAGGVVGVNSGTVTACYSSATVSAAGNYGYAGGVVGDNQGTVTACYSTGAVSADGTGGYAGGVAGANSGYGFVEACYWSGTETMSHGIGYDSVISEAPSNEGATQVDNTADWGATARSAMNDALWFISFGWLYQDNLDDNTNAAFPLILIKTS